MDQNHGEAKPEAVVRPVNLAIDRADNGDSTYTSENSVGDDCNAVDVSNNNDEDLVNNADEGVVTNDEEGGIHKSCEGTAVPALRKITMLVMSTQMT